MPTGAPHVVTVGESMVMLVPEDASPVGAGSRLVLRAGGAESNVAASLARLGHPTRWISVVGDDPFGRILTEELTTAGVGIDSVLLDPSAPTGIFVKSPQGGTTRVHYYRRGSAASRLGPATVTPAMVQGAGLIHLSGITPSLSVSCRELTEHVLARRSLGEATVSFDVNYRPGLWPVEEAAPVLLALSREADIVFVGRDEAEVLWGTTTAEQVRELLPEPAVLVVKDGALGASSFGLEGQFWADALRVAVVETVGAGDAFAAGWLSGWLRGYDPIRRLRLGHLIASRAVQVVDDCPAMPSSQEIADHLRLKEA